MIKQCKKVKSFNHMKLKRTYKARTHSINHFFSKVFKLSKPEKNSLKIK